MKCESNKIGLWLDEQCLKSRDDNPDLYGPIDWMSYYDGAMAVLDVAGFKVDVVPCGRGAIHIVNPPDKVVRSNNDGQMKLEV